MEESDEAVGWLEFMRDGEIGADPTLLAEAKEILVSPCVRTYRR